MTVPSIVAVGRTAERHIRQAGHALPVEDVVRWLINSLEVQDDTARAGVRLATIVGRLEGIRDDAGRPCLRLPAKTDAAA